MKAREIIALMDDFAPEELIDSWDNTGFQVGDDKIDIKGIVLSLDLNREVLNYALEKKANMIITHHPLIFPNVETVNNRTVKGSLIMDLVKNDMVFYSAHTNLDRAVGGVNDVLGDRLGLKNMELLEESIELEGRIYGYGRVGRIDSIYGDELIARVKDKLDVERLTVFGNVDKKVDIIAVCGGSGSSFIDDAVNKKADVFITGDIKYHDAQEAVDHGLLVIDPGHFYTERVVLKKLEEILVSKWPSLQVDVYNKSIPEYKIY